MTSKHPLNTLKNLEKSNHFHVGYISKYISISEHHLSYSIALYFVWTILFPVFPDLLCKCFGIHSWWSAMSKRRYWRWHSNWFFLWSKNLLEAGRYLNLCCSDFHFCLSTDIQHSCTKYMEKITYLFQIHTHIWLTLNPE